MAWKGVITDGGTDLFKSWAAGQPLNIKAAKTGSGTVDEGQLKQQTEVSNAGTIPCSVIGVKKKKEGLRVSVQVKPGEEAFSLKQIGIFASVLDSPDTLIALFQNEDGVNVPESSKAELYVYNFDAVIAVSNIQEFTFELDTEALVTHGEFDEAITEHGEAINRLASILGGLINVEVTDGTLKLPAALDVLYDNGTLALPEKSARFNEDDSELEISGDTVIKFLESAGNSILTIE